MGAEVVIGYISFLMVSGLLGNIFVVYVFGYKNRKTAFNFLITALGIYDILSCVIHMPLDIIAIYHPHLLPYSILCKVSCFLISLTVVSGSLVLLSVAVLHYRGITKPLSRALQPNEAKWVCVLTLIPSLVVSWPPLVIFENSASDGEGVNMCGVHNIDYQSYSISYHVILVGLFVANLLALACLYGFIARFLMKRKRVSNRSITISTLIPRVNSLNPGTNLTPISDHQQTTYMGTINTSAHFLAKPNNSASQNPEMKSAETDSDKKTGSNPNRRRSDNKGILMMFLVTLVFCISYVPHLTYALLFVFSDSETAVYLSTLPSTGILIRSFYINNFANPFIYALTSSDFKREVRKLFVKES